MKLHTLWKIWDGDNVELLFALDEYTVENNFEAWDEGVKKACEDYKITEGDTRIVLVEVPAAPIVAAFRPIKVKGTLVEAVEGVS